MEKNGVAISCKVTAAGGKSEMTQPTFMDTSECELEPPEVIAPFIHIQRLQDQASQAQKTHPVCVHWLCS